MPLRVAAIAFLNPAPLLYDFEHEPGKSLLSPRYDVRYTVPSACAAQLHSGEADLGLIPIASLTPDLAIVPGCTIASQQAVRSILLLVKDPRGLSTVEALKDVRNLAADTASRSSVAYTSVLFQQFTGAQPAVQEQAADPVNMLAACDAALLIGDPALLAREARTHIESSIETPLLWLDVATLWRELTNLPWVAAVWAVRPKSLIPEGLTPDELISDLNASRDAGLAHIEELVAEWTPRIAIPPATIRTYLTQNIHYRLDPDCEQAIHRFRRLAAEAGILPPLPGLLFL